MKDDIQNLFKMTIDQLLEGIQIIDWDGHILYVNKAVVKQSRLTEDLLLNRRLVDIFPGVENTQMYRVLMTVMRDREAQHIENHFEFSESEKAWFSLHFEPHSMGVLIRSIEITEQKKIEEQYWNTQKLEALGQFAGGVAHDFNNKLGAIQLLCDLARQEARSLPVLASYLENIQSAAEQATRFTRQLMSYSREQLPQPRRLDLNEHLRRSREGLRHMLREHIDLRLDLSMNPVWIQISISQIDQILLNLCLNSVEAMPTGGVLTLLTGEVTLDEDFCRKHGHRSPGRYVRLRVADSGRGMSDEIRLRAKEPFFTTKNQVGAGLGLAMVCGIIAQNQGLLEIESRPGTGTSVDVFFPFQQESPDDGDSSLETRGVPVVTKQFLLLVEDDLLSRTAFELALRKAGYSVLSAANAENAERLLMETEEEVSLLVTDVILPGIGGIEFAERMKNRFPRLKVLFVSGYSRESLPSLNGLAEGTRLLQKPVSMGIFLKNIEEQLEQRLKEE